MIKKLQHTTERGQAIVLIAMSIIGLIAIIGLMMDSGILFIEYARLKRAIDSASIAASLQYRQGFTSGQLQQHLVDAATEFLRLNQSDVSGIKIDTYLTDPSLVTSPQRKLVRVTATRHVTFGFMRILGFTGTDITANSVGEAASVDMVLVLDTSASMAYETPDTPVLNAPPNVPNSDTTPLDPDVSDDPSLCNQNLTDLCTAATCPCQPLWSVKNAAIQLLDTLFFPYDRVAIVTMTSQNADGSRDPYVLLPLNSVRGDVETALQNLKVYQPRTCPQPLDNSAYPCLNFAGGHYSGLECPVYRTVNPQDPSSCTSSNVGDAMLLAGDEFARSPVREDSLWVVIALVGGPANASTAHNGHPYGFCPESATTPGTWESPFCRDRLASTRHCTDGAYRASCEAAGGTYNPARYDAEDYARDLSDFVADPNTGQGATVFTIGLGEGLIRHASPGDPDAAEKLLQYMSEISGGLTANHGFYSFAPDANGLAAIFQKIADNIFTRISQ